jgi:glyoxylase-like metal-dependent hydrolase (beta-lactamase superfamily II)
VELLGRLKPAPEKLTPKIDLFPSYGASPGNASLLVSAARTIVVAGDAVVTRDHFAEGRVWDRSADPIQAKESIVEKGVST